MRKAALARALVCNPDVLLLDEPTNHLDVDAIEWLENFLMEFGGSIVFISHDLGAAKALCPDVITLEPADPNTDLTAATAIFRKNWDDYS